MNFDLGQKKRIYKTIMLYSHLKDRIDRQFTYQIYKSKLKVFLKH